MTFRPEVRSEALAFGQWAMDWLEGLRDAGFTDDQAMRLLIATTLRGQSPALPPEFIEFLTKQSRLAERMLEE